MIRKRRPVLCPATRLRLAGDNEIADLSQGMTRSPAAGGSAVLHDGVGRSRRWTRRIAATRLLAAL